jgi:hypothetical protein
MGAPVPSPQRIGTTARQAAEVPERLHFACQWTKLGGSSVARRKFDGDGE